MAQHRVLLTGAAGFKGSHILSQLLHASSTRFVRAAVRSQAERERVESFYPLIPKLDVVVAATPEEPAPGAFDEMLKHETPFDIVIHTWDPYIKSTTELLEGIQRVSKNGVRRVIMTSAFAAVTGHKGFTQKGFTGQAPTVYTESKWGPENEAQSVGSDINFLDYTMKKTRAEKVAWDFARKNKVSWDLVTLILPFVYGPLALGHQVESVKGLSYTCAMFYYAFFQEMSLADKPRHDVDAIYYVDVRDVARAARLAMSVATAGNNRFLVTADPITAQEVCDILQTNVDGMQNRVPEGRPGHIALPADLLYVDRRKAVQVLGMTYRTEIETFRDLGEQLLMIEKAGGD